MFDDETTNDEGTGDERVVDFLDPVMKINRDLLKALKNEGQKLTREEARYMVTAYYDMQKLRISTGNQIGALEREAKARGEEPKPSELINWLHDQLYTLETQIPKVMQAYIGLHEMGWFFERTLGVGPILAAGLVTHIDIHRAPTAGHIWNFAGISPSVKWEKGQKRPFNAALKLVCWKIGQSFVKLSGRADAYYGQVYKKRKALEVERNEAFQFVSQAAEMLRKVPNHEQRAIYATGKLPPGQLDIRAQRYAVKLFLSHLQECWWRQATGTEPPKPFAIAIQGHAHYLPPPQLQGRDLA